MIRKYNAPVIMISQDMHKYKEVFAFLGDILDKKEQARKLSDFIISYLEPIEKIAQSILKDKRASVYYAEGKDGLMSEPQGSNHIQALEYAGGVSVARIPKQKRPPLGPPPKKNMTGPGKEKKLRPRPNNVTIEQISKWNPSYILVWSPGAEELTTWNAITTNPQWQTVNAVKAGKMIQVPSIPYSWFDRPPGSNRIIGTIWLAKLLYPDKYDFDLIPVMQEYFKLFYHSQLSTGQAANLLKTAHPDQQ
ncbi:ABC transporter substrate-binding protein [uncultured Desulfobacter sp.]|uniref:ABC transporter substrate-binding protein n=1 Tax=uncultured Desulfobacter sp. TaxID=240139 RepID=UPI002AA66474|nr:ABC transporter substrate-binding protein [uncultured Desulfobacter sp.]